MTSNILAYDRVGTVRTFDEDGRLKIAKTPISKACVNEYIGHELNSYTELGLSPERLYKILRDPAELEKAAQTFNRLPVLDGHYHVTADDPNPEKTVGTTGDSCEFSSPFLMNSMTVWDKKAIDSINSGAKREISCAYRYDLDMTPGEFNGEKYDGVFRNIRGSHVALVSDGRAGPEVLVADSKLKNESLKKMPENIEEIIKGLKPFLKDDASLEDLVKVLGDTTVQDNENPEDPESNNKDDLRARLAAAGFSDEQIDRMCASLATDEEPTEEEKRAEEERLRREEEERLKKEKPVNDDGEEKPEVDINEAIAEAEKRIRESLEKKFAELAKAKEETREITGNIAMDSAEAVYKFALGKMGVDTKGLPSSALRATFRAIHQNNRKSAAAPKQKLANDSARAATFMDRFPNLKRIKLS